MPPVLENLVGRQVTLGESKWGMAAPWGTDVKLSLRNHRFQLCPSASSFLRVVDPSGQLGQFP